MTPHQFIAKWRSVELKERTASQSHFNDLCALLGVVDHEATPTRAGSAKSESRKHPLIPSEVEGPNSSEAENLQTLRASATLGSSPSTSDPFRSEVYPERSRGARDERDWFRLKAGRSSPSVEPRKWSAHCSARGSLPARSGRHWSCRSHVGKLRMVALQAVISSSIRSTSCANSNRSWSRSSAGSQSAICGKTTL